MIIGDLMVLLNMLGLGAVATVPLKYNHARVRPKEQNSRKAVPSLKRRPEPAAQPQLFLSIKVENSKTK